MSPDGDGTHKLGVLDDTKQLNYSARALIFLGIISGDMTQLAL